MPFWRRNETLDEQPLREAGLDPAQLAEPAAAEQQEQASRPPAAADAAVTAERLDGDLWEIRVDPL